MTLTFSLGHEFRCFVEGEKQTLQILCSAKPVGPTVKISVEDFPGLNGDWVVLSSMATEEGVLLDLYRSTKLAYGPTRPSTGPSHPRQGISLAGFPEQVTT